MFLNSSLCQRLSRSVFGKMLVFSNIGPKAIFRDLAKPNTGFRSLFWLCVILFLLSPAWAAEPPLFLEDFEKRDKPLTKRMRLNSISSKQTTNENGPVRSRDAFSEANPQPVSAEKFGWKTAALDTQKAVPGPKTGTLKAPIESKAGIDAKAQEPLERYNHAMVEAMDMLFVFLHAIERRDDWDLERKQQETINFIRRIRWGSMRQYYFWVNDLEGKMILEPIYPKTEGDNWITTKDLQNNKIFEAYINTGLFNGEGFVDQRGLGYDNSKSNPRISFVRLFKIWGWIVGTGVEMVLVKSYETPDATAKSKEAEGEVIAVASGDAGKSGESEAAGTAGGGESGETAEATEAAVEDVEAVEQIDVPESPETAEIPQEDEIPEGAEVVEAYEAPEMPEFVELYFLSPIDEESPINDGAPASPI
jgi:cache domain-containing protein